MIFASVYITDKDEESQHFYQGGWKLSAERFVVEQTPMCGFIGEYRAYRENDTIRLEGSGKQGNAFEAAFMSPGEFYDQADTPSREIVLIMKQEGNNVKEMSYMDDKLHSYEILKNTTFEEYFDLMVKFWEGRLTTEEDERFTELTWDAERVRV